MEYYTIQDVSRILQVSKKTAYRIAKMKDFHVVRIGRAIRIKKDEFDRYIAGVNRV